MERSHYRLLDETGLSVVETEGPDKDAFADIMHYSLMYGQDGPVKIEQKIKGKWLHVSGIGPKITVSSR